MRWLFVRPTRFCLLDFFCSGIQFYSLLSHYLYLFVISWGLSCKPNIYVFLSSSELRVKLALLNWFNPSSCLYVLCGHLLGKG